MDQEVLREIAAAWRSANNIVVFTGAGMSTESGLPDFRSKQGLWKDRPETLATLAALKAKPDEFYFFYQWRIARLWEVQPNPGHLALAELAQAGFVTKLVTQNVDGLHQRAGSQGVAELHGTLRTVSCIKCGSQYDSRQMLPHNDTWEEDYKAGRYRHGSECYCPRCQGQLRPDVVLFGESLPDTAWNEAVRWSRKADFFVVIGSSLVVSPANYLPQLAVEQGAKLLIINSDSTPLDDAAAWVIREKAGEVLTGIKELILRM
ncbi:Silent information regulator protein Sir2 [Thermosinus carboxydivorans Nor1]|uniref:protein acetyllysine N-acetyltransferase n=1 Tax=Thermosinus carboxydivorans Nor1 TaxID=401526 RepID=A1HLU5_9FIRM|nr:NAD-dependent deacylase [Thermosinus carboxydivorans]EAX48799.1 Silent information regulator protein Sir2 [Thermosinus carboxydivorans Nor1]